MPPDRPKPNERCPQAQCRPVPARKSLVTVWLALHAAAYSAVSHRASLVERRSDPAPHREAGKAALPQASGAVFNAPERAFSHSPPRQATSCPPLRWRAGQAIRLRAPMVFRHSGTCVAFGFPRWVQEGLDMPTRRQDELDIVRAEQAEGPVACLPWGYMVRHSRQRRNASAVTFDKSSMVARDIKLTGMIEGLVQPDVQIVGMELPPEDWWNHCSRTGCQRAADPLPEGNC